MGERFHQFQYEPGVSGKRSERWKLLMGKEKMDGGSRHRLRRGCTAALAVTAIGQRAAAVLSSLGMVQVCPRGICPPVPGFTRLPSVPTARIIGNRGLRVSLRRTAVLLQ